MKTACILGCGFIGHHMARRLKSEGYWVRLIDIEEYQYGEELDFCDEFVFADLRDSSFTNSVLRLNEQKKYSYLPTPFEKLIEFDEIYCFAARMGGALYVFTGDHDADIMHDSALINLNICNALQNQKFNGKVFYSSSACMYPQELQSHILGNVVTCKKNDEGILKTGLKESDAYPLNPDSDYGLEKAFSERLYLAYARNYNLNVRIARFHNIYGPEGTYKGGREKAPAAMCRKVIALPDYIPLDYSEAIPYMEVLGDGQQTRSFLYIDDCIDAVRLLMESDFKEPINIGSEEMISINELAQMAIDISGKTIAIKNVSSNALGVRGRNSDNTLIRKVLNWQPKYSLKEGLEKTFNWIQNEIRK